MHRITKIVIFVGMLLYNILIKLGIRTQKLLVAKISSTYTSYKFEFIASATTTRNTSVLFLLVISYINWPLLISVVLS